LTTPTCTDRAPRPPLTRLWVVLALTVVTFAAEVVGSWYSGSLALLADAGHLLTDGGAVGLTILTAWLAGRPATVRRTYGHLRWEVLGALINGAVLLALSAWIVVEAVQRVRAPVAVESGVLLVVAVAGLLTNAIALALLHRDKEGSLNLRGAYLHVLGDLLGSVGVIAAAVVIRTTGWMAADPLVSIVLALMIVVGAWRLVRESVEVLLEEVPRHIALEEVERRMLGVAGVTAVHDLHVWTVTSGMVAMSGHAVVPALADHPRVLEALQRAVNGSGIAHATIQLEVEGPCPEPERDGQPGHGHHHPHGHSHP
jgi:cobalt-zinc-cadmium efflux system protein